MPKLTIVPTPIGNLGDITLRAIEVLQNADLVLAEDTRVTRKLLTHLGINPPKLWSYGQHNEHRSAERLPEEIRSLSKGAALVSDAGTPGISDPAYLLVRACLQEGIEVECLPGPTALIPALVESGLPTSSFLFLGFLPHKKGRETKYREIAACTHTIALYESPHRLLKTLEGLLTHCGPDRRMSISRELSKHFHQTLRGTIAELHAHFHTTEPRGEFVLVVAGAQD